MSGSSLQELAIEAQTSFPALLQWLQAERPYEHEERGEYKVHRSPLESPGITPYVCDRVPFQPKAHKPPHPVYIEGETILGKTKYGIPVTPEQFQNNSFLENGKDAEDLSGEQWWVAKQSDRLQSLEKLDSRVEAGSIISLTPSEKFDLEAWQRERKAKGFNATREPKHTASKSSLSNYGRWLEENEAAHNGSAVDARVGGRSSFASSTERSEYRRWLESHQTTIDQGLEDYSDVEHSSASESLLSFRTAAALPHERVHIRVVNVRPAEPTISLPREQRSSGHSILVRSLSRVMKSKYSRYTKTDVLTPKEYLASQTTKKGKAGTKKPDCMSAKESIEYQANEKELGILYNIKRVTTSIPSIPSMLKGIANTKHEARKYRRRHIQLERPQICHEYQIAHEHDQPARYESTESLMIVQPARPIRQKKQILCRAGRRRVRFHKSKEVAPYIHVCKDDDAAFPEVTEDRHLWIAGGFESSALHDRFKRGWSLSRLNEVVSKHENEYARSGYIDGGFEMEGLGDFDYLPPLEKESRASISTTTRD
ncbi:hypothetical protein HYALB_00004628 [Hymenoscyphus albidus]|uniref:Uncharacterized protein n=1 Tax=Hymenoscyphus albidus TaxID=595503 RepID=A0A9N9M1G1_9HELO|nr:hypothetical protein HYALB_00004628 [Hymenoscyphus albidus]